MKQLVLCITLILAPLLSAAQSGVLFSNGADPGDLCYYPVNHGNSVADEFPIGTPSEVTGITASLYTVSPSDAPQLVSYAITDQPFGGNTYISGWAPLSIVSGPAQNWYLLYTWQVEAPVNVKLTTGIYYLQLAGESNRNLNTFAWWGCALSGIPAYFNNSHQVINSESFQVLGYRLQ